MAFKLVFIIDVYLAFVMACRTEDVQGRALTWPFPNVQHIGAISWQCLYSLWKTSSHVKCFYSFHKCLLFRGQNGALSCEWMQNYCEGTGKVLQGNNECNLKDITHQDPNRALWVSFSCIQEQLKRTYEPFCESLSVFFHFNSSLSALPGWTSHHKQYD